jgi:hypothetical protein
MTRSDPKTDLHSYLRSARDAIVWKLDGLPEYDIRRPLTPTGTNLLGLIKHLAGVEDEYFGLVFGRPSGITLPWAGDLDDQPNVDMWATADESRDYIVGLYRQVWAHADATIEELPLDAPGQVPWWGEQGEVDLHRMLVHVIAETNRHGGHADIVRELIDGSAGLRAGGSNLPSSGPEWWSQYRAQVELAAQQAARD